MGIFDKFKSGLGKSSLSLSDGFKNIFSKKKTNSQKKKITFTKNFITFFRLWNWAIFGQRNR